jgi:hypothetical protein
MARAASSRFSFSRSLLMRSPTVGGYAIANYLHLLGQIVEGLQLLQPNRVFAMPKSHAATKVISSRLGMYFDDLRVRSPSLQNS